jgi:hypothetical protein
METIPTREMLVKAAPTIKRAAILLVCVASQSQAQQTVRIPTADVPLSLGARVAFTVGSDDGHEAEAFGSVGGVTFDAAENLYVLDRVNARVVVFDSTGRFVRMFGRRGRGPGEFGAPQHITTTASGEIAVTDVGNRAVLVFGADGRFRRNIPIGLSSLPVGRTLAGHPRGGVVSLAMGNPANRGARALRDEVILWYPDRGGAPTPLLVLSSGSDPRNGRSAQPPVFSPVPEFAVLSTGGLAIADQASYRIKIIGPDGRIQRVLTRAISPRRVTEADRQLERERQAAELAPGRLTIVGARSGTLPPPIQAAIARQMQNADFASVMPVIQRLSIDAAGNLWVERSGPAAGRRGPIDIITPAGRYLGTVGGVRLPSAFSAGGRAAHVETDGDGVQRVVVVRMNRVPR